MAKYLYVFAYQTIEQREAAARNGGFSEESSAAFFIEAARAEEALDWGRLVSSRFVAERLGAHGVTWDPEQFAHWIETQPEREYPTDHLAALPVVPVGAYPDWTTLQS